MQLKLNIIENEKVVETVVKETNTDLSGLISAIEDFRQLVNSVFTDKILNNQVLDTSSGDDDECSSSDDEKECPKKKKR